MGNTKSSAKEKNAAVLKEKINTDFTYFFTKTGIDIIQLLTKNKDDLDHYGAPIEIKQYLSETIDILNKFKNTGVITVQHLKEINEILGFILYINYIINRNNYNIKDKIILNKLKTNLYNPEDYDKNIFEYYNVYEEQISQIMIAFSIIFLSLYSNINFKFWEQYDCQFYFLQYNILMNKENKKYSIIHDYFSEFLAKNKDTIDSKIKILVDKNTSFTVGGAQYTQYCYES